MHCLEVIIKKNAQATGRAEAHAQNDGDCKRATKILRASFQDDPTTIAAYEQGYARGRQEW